MEFKTNIENQIIGNAKKLAKTIVLPEAGYSERVYNAGIIAANEGIAKVIFLVKADNELDKFNHKAHQNVQIININTSELKANLVNVLLEKRKDKGLTQEQANELIKSEIYFGTLMVEAGFADGMVCGAENTTANSLKPALQIIKGKTPSSIISTFMIMATNETRTNLNDTYVLADCGLNVNPSATELSQIVFDTAKNAKLLANLEPKVALLCYSTFGSAVGEVAQKMIDTKNMVLERRPTFVIDGEYQLDAAIDPVVASLKAKNGAIKGDANVFIFPDLTSGNITYKTMQRFGGYKAIGPICQGLNKPVNDLSRGAIVSEIILTIAITCLQSK